MDKHVSILGWLQIALGILDLVVALAVYTFWMLADREMTWMFGKGR